MPSACRKCVVRRCGCGSANKSPFQKLYSFPSSPRLRSAWLRLLRLDESTLKTNSRVCSRHFEGNEFTGKKLPMIDIGLSEVETRKIVADYLHQVILKTKRPLGNVLEDAAVFMENEDEYEDNFGLSDLFSHADEEAGLTSTGLVVNVTSSIDMVNAPSTSGASLYLNREEVDAMEIVGPEETGDRAPSGDIGRIEVPATPIARILPNIVRQLPEYPSKTTAQSHSKSKSVGTQTQKSRMCIDELTATQVRLFTGIRREAFDILFKHTCPLARAATYWMGPKRTKSKSGNEAFYVPLDDEDEADGWETAVKSDEDLRCELFLTLMKLRTNVTYDLLEYLFGWRKGKISSIIHTWLDILSRFLKDLILFPSQAECWKLIPPRIKPYFPRLRLIVDCTEIPIQRPMQTFLQAITFSLYKKRNTIKILVGILPNGQICFISQVVTGRASDRYIMDHCGLMDLLTRGDTVLADRGFGITDELLVRGIALNAPPGATGRMQFTREEVRRGSTIAKVRIHVERAIGRMKVFKILDSTMPIPFVPIADKIVTVVAALCNLQPRLIS